MQYDYKDEADTYLLEFIEAFFAGRTHAAESALGTLKESFGDSAYTKIADLMNRCWNEGPVSMTSEESVALFNEIQLALEHTCERDPCRVCTEKSYSLTCVALWTGLYSDAIQQADKLLVLQEDDIMVRMLRGQAWLLSSEEAATEEETVACLTAALADFEYATELVATLPDGDDKVYNLRYSREDSTDNPEFIAGISDAIDKKRFVQDFNPRGKGTGRDAEPPPFDWLSTPVDLLVDGTLKPLIGDALVDLGRFDEALPVLISSLKAARRSGNEEMIASMVYSIGPTLLKVGRFDEAVPFFIEALTLAGLDEELQDACLTWLDVCLLDLKSPGDVIPSLTEALAQWASSDAGRQSLVTPLLDKVEMLFATQEAG